MKKADLKNILLKVVKDATDPKRAYNNKAFWACLDSHANKLLKQINIEKEEAINSFKAANPPFECITDEM